MEKTEYAKGMPENPFTPQELRDKFRDLSSIVLPKVRVEELIKTIDSLEDMDDVRVLSRMLAR